MDRLSKPFYQRSARDDSSDRGSLVNCGESDFSAGGNFFSRRGQMTSSHNGTNFKFFDPKQVQKPKFIKNKYLLAMHRNHGELVGYSSKADLKKL